MKVGGRDFNESKRNVELAMRAEDPESLQKYAVEVNGINYPPKQVLATVTGWERTSFTTMEAQRVLKKLGFESFDISVIQSGRRTFAPAPDDTEPQSSINQRISALEAGLVTAQEAVASLAARVRKLEGSA
jgi:hypothetical protein